ncbi:hypothetical protein FDN13_04720 [Caloramator sp. E03]|uniref:hypothetical protein n=1 Tax=Caloramator sp. E03 TaxID=2576307 RepID=UPI0011100925|nr:hypothetical protein [Caloramator sp. E03]QCX33069.1 hypothetical protein FDN13_04720 [Caloramator sp. E03]
MDFNDLFKNLNIEEDYVDIILLILIIATINSLSNNTHTYPFYTPCYFYECCKKRKKHHKHSIENTKAEVLDNNSNTGNFENTFGFFNTYSSSSQNNLLFVILIVALLFLIEKLNINNDQNIESSEV